MVVALYVAIAVVSFLFALNGFMRGSATAKMQVILGSVLAALVGATLLISGWIAAFGSALLALAGPTVLRPIAARAAARHFASSHRRAGDYVGLPPRTLRTISRELGEYARRGDLDAIFTEADKDRTARTSLFEYCSANAQLQQLLAEFGLTKAALEELYFELLSGGAGQWRGGHWVAASTLAYPEALRYYLTARAEGAGEIMRVYPLLEYFESGTPFSSWQTGPAA